jgi:hypothetical protein
MLLGIGVVLGAYLGFTPLVPSSGRDAFTIALAVSEAAVALFAVFAALTCRGTERVLAVVGLGLAVLPFAWFMLYITTSKG